MRLRYLIDTSAMLRVARSQEVADVVRPLLIQGSLAICAPALLEIMYAVRATEYDQILQAYQQSLTLLPLDGAGCTRAIAVQQLLAKKSQHRTAKAIDLLIAACAEINGLTVLHYDRDYDAIAKVTGQLAMWVVPAGSVP
jgi:predicted nucleic acid-binding protein